MTTRIKQNKKSASHVVAKKTSYQRKIVLEKGAKDFAVRFKRVMKDLSKG